MRSYTLPALGALLVAAAAFGVHLGESAVAEINPAHFRGPAIHPRDRGAIVDEAAVTPAGPRFAALYGWAEGNRARAEDCIDCEALRARDADRAAVYVPPPEPAYRPARAQIAAAEPEVVYEVKWREVDRYARYPITAEEAAALDAAADALAAYSE
jgi:hypothetical protein